MCVCVLRNAHFECAKPAAQISALMSYPVSCFINGAEPELDQEARTRQKTKKQHQGSEPRTNDRGPESRTEDQGPRTFEACVAATTGLERHLAIRRAPMQCCRSFTRTREQKTRARKYRQALFPPNLREQPTHPLHESCMTFPLHVCERFGCV